MVSLLFLILPLLAAGDPEAAAAALKNGDAAAAIDLLGDLPEASDATVDVLRLAGLREIRELTVDLIRLFYRHEQREPTQIAPDGTIGQPNYRETAVTIPKAAVGGKAVVKLYYLLVHSWPVEQKGMLVAQLEVSLKEEG